MTIPFKQSPIEFNQRLLFPSNIFDLLPGEHECYLYGDIFKELDTSSLESKYSKNGQNAYHPRLLVSILIYAYSQGIFSSRQIERRCNEDLSFMYNLEALKAANLDAYIATNKGEKKNKTPLDESNRKLTKADFVFNEQDDCFTCPGGQTLVLKSTSKDGKKKYQGSSETCSKCNYQSRCCKSATGQARTINTDDKEPIRQQMNEKMEAVESKEIYKQRKVIVEPVFGQIKNTGFKGFSVRGKTKTSGEFSLVCAVHNIKKITKALFREVVCSEFGKLVPVRG